MAYALILTAVFTQIAPKDEAANKAAQTRQVRYSPDPSWVQTEGAQGHVILNGAAACDGYLAFQEVVKARRANDKLGLDKLKEEKFWVPAPFATPVLVIKVYRPVPAPSSSRVLSGAGALSRAVQEGVTSGPADTEVYPLEVRVLDGPLKGQTKFFGEWEIGRLITSTIRTKPARKPSKGANPVAPAAKADPAVKAKTLLQMAQNLERNNKTAPALNYYHQILNRYPGTPQAKTAAERVKALGKQ